MRAIYHMAKARRVVRAETQKKSMLSESQLKQTEDDTYLITKELIIESWQKFRPKSHQGSDTEGKAEAASPHRRDRG